MIDLEQAKNKFLEVVQNYDETNENIKRKIGHSIRVMNVSEKLAIKVGLSEEEVKVAALIGLLHDIGRFKQYQKYHTYKDLESVDHAKIGIKLLFFENKIREYILDNQYDNIIKKAILQHNQYRLNKRFLTEKEKLFCQILKDADKIDILFEAITMFWNSKKKQMEESIISKDVYEAFMDETLIRHEIKKTLADQVIGILSFIYDINLKESFEMILEGNYLNQIIYRFHFSKDDTKNKFEKIHEKIESYIGNVYKKEEEM